MFIISVNTFVPELWKTMADFHGLNIKLESHSKNRKAIKMIADDISSCKIKQTQVSPNT